MLRQGYDQNGLPSHMPMESAFGPRCGTGSPEGALLEAPATWWKMTVSLLRRFFFFSVVSRCELIEENIRISIYSFLSIIDACISLCIHTCRRLDMYLCMHCTHTYLYIYTHIFADVFFYMYTYTQVLPTQNQVHTHIDLFKVPTYMWHYIENKTINILCTLDIRASPFQ